MRIVKSQKTSIHTADTEVLFPIGINLSRNQDNAGGSPVFLSQEPPWPSVTSHWSEFNQNEFFKEYGKV